MTFRTPAPTIMTVYLTDFTRCPEFQIAVRADVVVSIVTDQAVEASCRSRDGMCTDVAIRGE